MSTSSQNPGVPKLANPREFVEAINELKTLTREGGVSRMFDLLTAVVAYSDNAAYTKAIEAVRSEYLNDDTKTPEDEAYNQGVSDAIAAIGALLEGGAK
jgi:hypothetical protein